MGNKQKINQALNHRSKSNNRSDPWLRLKKYHWIELLDLDNTDLKLQYHRQQKVYPNNVLYFTNGTTTIEITRIGKKWKITASKATFNTAPLAELWKYF
jgi:hypothetical protein